VLGRLRVGRHVLFIRAHDAVGNLRSLRRALRITKN
jgi:hypothetical protein